MVWLVANNSLQSQVEKEDAWQVENKGRPTFAIDNKN